MIIDFFNTPCKELPRTDLKFGICDDQEGERAYTNTDDDTKWIATVNNQNSRTITFTAIDHCMEIKKVGDKDQESTCDGMLTYAEGILFVELKDQKERGIATAKAQLENTLKLFLLYHEDINYKYKKAYICNVKHPTFKVIDNETQKSFFSDYGFRLDINTEILIK
jgi:hypothetical protein